MPIRVESHYFDIPRTEVLPSATTDCAGPTRSYFATFRIRNGRDTLKMADEMQGFRQEEWSYEDEVAATMRKFEDGSLAPPVVDDLVWLAVDKATWDKRGTGRRRTVLSGNEEKVAENKGGSAVEKTESEGNEVKERDTITTAEVVNNEDDPMHLQDPLRGNYLEQQGKCGRFMIITPLWRCRHIRHTLEYHCYQSADENIMGTYFM